MFGSTLDALRRRLLRTDPKLRNNSFPFVLGTGSHSQILCHAVAVAPHVRSDFIGLMVLRCLFQYHLGQTGRRRDGQADTVGISVLETIHESLYNSALDLGTFFLKVE